MDKVLFINQCEPFSSFDSGKRVYSGVSAILDFEVVNFRDYNCSAENEGRGRKDCHIVEFFLTVDTSRKMQNGVNIDISIDRCADCISLSHTNDYFRGVNILRNDLDAILHEIFDSKVVKTERHLVMPPERDERINTHTPENVNSFSGLHTMKRGC